MGGPPDTGGAKNAIQARASAKTYLERYTLLAATGLASANSDNDGNGSGQGSQIPEQQYIEHLDNIQNAGTLVELQRVFGVAYKMAEEAKDKNAQAKFIASKDARKKELK
jgi:hypothetical protein